MKYSRNQQNPRRQKWTEHHLVQESSDIGCRKSLRDARYTVILRNLDTVVILPENAWHDSELQCGSLTGLLDPGKPSSVICWNCAHEKGFVNKTEEKHHENQVDQKRCQLWW
jgi:hypothetical protein